MEIRRSRSRIRSSKAGGASWSAEICPSTAELQRSSLLVATLGAVPIVLAGAPACSRARKSPYESIVRDRPTTRPSPSPPLEGGRMVKSPGGVFMMGSERDDKEKPVHPVVVTTFAMDAAEVTVAS